jgi:hypothetical protein
MKIASKLAANWMFFATTVVFLGWLSVSPARVEAQTGPNAVYQTGSVVPSSAFIDASVYPGGDICAKIYNVLTTGYPSSGAVVDARGISGTALTCTVPGNTPWIHGIARVSVPSHILLPSGTITINTSWSLPNYTTITGEGPINTIISSALPSSPPLVPMIVMGDATCSSACFSIAVEDLTLEGNGQNIDGIDNSAAGELSYVDHVTMHQVEGTGLRLESGAGNSGPYSNIEFTAVTAFNSATACVRITTTDLTKQLSTRGIHGITCEATSTQMSQPAAAIYLDGNSNTIEDMHVEGYHDGILVGDSEPTGSNILININGAAGAGPVTNVIDISNQTNTSGTPNVSDLAILGTRSAGATNSIEDELTSTTLSDANVAMYVLGEPIGGVAGAYSRFTTTPDTPNAVTWGVGNGVPSGSCKVGSLYSNTGPLSPNTTLYVCVPAGLTTAWTALNIP